MVKKLPFVKQPISHGKGYVILARLKDYYDFVTDKGQIVDALFEFNVRDYQSGAALNKEIAATLADEADEADFWWLNNGVTILAEEAAAQDNKLTIKNPIVVNGLQTSHEIHRFFAGGGEDKEDRSVQVRDLDLRRMPLFDSLGTPKRQSASSRWYNLSQKRQVREQVINWATFLVTVPSVFPRQNNCLNSFMISQVCSRGDEI